MATDTDFSSLSGCSRTSGLVDIKRPETAADRNAIRQSPIVFVGVLNQDTISGPVVRGKSWKTLLQLHKLDITVEECLRGSVPSKRAKIYYFQLAVASDGNRVLGSWNDVFGHLESRRIFFIRPDAGVLRLACDGVDTCTIAVDSGIPTSVEAAAPIDKKIADVLLTPSAHINLEKFTDRIGINLNKVDQRYWQPKLVQLILSPDPLIRDRACEEAVEYVGSEFVKHEVRCQPYLARVRAKLNRR